MRYGSVCSGIEAASVAWAPLGWTPSFFSEIDAFPRAVLAHHYPETPLHGDFTTIEAGQYEPIDLLVGGTPCQSFSVAGLRGGLDDGRGNLALEFCRLARRLGPRCVIWENVPGVLSIDGGRAFASILGGLAQCGYGLAYRVLDAQYVRVDGYPRAVPQRRQRVFVVGYLGDWRRAAAVLFEPEGLRRDPPPRRQEGSDAACGTLGGTSPGGVWRFGADEAAAGQLIAGTLTSAHGGADVKHAQSSQLIPFDPTQITSQTNRSNPQPGGPCHTLAKGQSAPAIAFGGGLTSGPIDAAATLTAKGMRIDFEVETFVSVPPVSATLVGRSSRGGGQINSPGHNADQCLVAHTLRADGFDASEDSTGRDTPLVPVAETLTAHWHHSQGQKAGDNVGLMNPISHASGVRRLTPTECERLQGYPDGYTLIPYGKALRAAAKDELARYFERRGEFFREESPGNWVFDRSRFEAAWPRMAADGPRYKALGNSMAINVMRWIGTRIAMVEGGLMNHG